MKKRYDLRKLSTEHARKHFPDIYAIAAARMFNKALKDVTLEERMRAKAENHRRMYSTQFVRTVNYGAQSSHADINRRIGENLSGKDFHSIIIDDCIYFPDWHLDTHSTVLSRKTSFHKREGKLNYAKTRHVTSVYSFKYRCLCFINFLRTMVFLRLLPPKTIKSTASRIKTNQQTGELEYHC